MDIFDVLNEFGRKVDLNIDRAMDEFDKKVLNYSSKIKDNGDNYSVKIDIPGFEREEIEIDIVQPNIDGGNNILNLKAKNATEGTKSLAFYIPKDINKGAIIATLKNGQLILTLPKMKKDPPSTLRVRVI